MLSHAELVIKIFFVEETSNFNLVTYKLMENLENVSKIAKHSKIIVLYFFVLNCYNLHIQV